MRYCRVSVRRWCGQPVNWEAPVSIVRNPSRAAVFRLWYCYRSRDFAVKFRLFVNVCKMKLVPWH